MIEEKQNRRNKRKNNQKDQITVEDNSKAVNKEKFDSLVKEYLKLKPETLSAEDVEKIKSYYIERIEAAVRLKEEGNFEELHDLAEITVKFND